MVLRLILFCIFSTKFFLIFFNFLNFFLFFTFFNFFSAISYQHHHKMLGIYDIKLIYMLVMALMASLLVRGAVQYFGLITIKTHRRICADWPTHT